MISGKLLSIYETLCLHICTYVCMMSVCLCVCACACERVRECVCVCPYLGNSMAHIRLN